MMSRSLTQAKERGLEHISEKKMSLTYRGLKYNPVSYTHLTLPTKA